jgi:hypothetical protein
LGGAGKAQED